MKQPVQPQDRMQGQILLRMQTAAIKMCIRDRDKAGVGQMRELLKALKKQGKAILLASHNAQDIEELCDDVHEMEEKWK